MHNFRTTKKRERKEKRAAKISKNFSEGMSAQQNKNILSFVNNRL